MVMATEAIKLLVGIGQPLTGRLMLYDSLRMSFRDVKIRRNPDCELCGDHPTITELIDYEAFCGVPARSD
jgi:adenylyltransferase/sulfurtransferase